MKIHSQYREASLKPTRRAHVRRNRRDGFTLIEILLVAGILVIMAGMATYGFLGMQKNATASLARSEISTMAGACTAYAINHVGKFPAKLRDLSQPPQGETAVMWGGPYIEDADMKDPWGTDYKYQPDQNQQRVTISSAGPDGQFGTEDDVSNRAVQQ